MNRLLIALFMTPMLGYASCQPPFYGSDQRVNQLAQNQYEQCQENERRFQQQQYQQSQQETQKILNNMQSTLQQIQNPSYRQNQQPNNGARLLGQ